MPPDYQYDKNTFDVDDAGLPKYTPSTHHHPALTVQTANLPRQDLSQQEFGYHSHATPQAQSTRRPTSRGSRGRPLPPTPGGPRPMHQQQPPPPMPVPQVASPVHAPPPPPPPSMPVPVTMPYSPPQSTLSPLTPALTGSSTSSYSVRSPPLPRPSLPPVSETIVSLAPKVPGHTCAGRSLDIVFYRGDATALPMYGRGDRVEGYIDLKNTKDICQIEITVRLLSNHLPSLVHCRISGGLACPDWHRPIHPLITPGSLKGYST